MSLFPCADAPSRLAVVGLAEGPPLSERGTALPEGLSTSISLCLSHPPACSHEIAVKIRRTADSILILQCKTDSRYLSLLRTLPLLEVAANHKAGLSGLASSQGKVIWLASAYPKRRENSLRFGALGTVLTSF